MFIATGTPAHYRPHQVRKFIPSQTTSMKLLFLVATAVSTLSLAQAAALAPPIIAIEDYGNSMMLSSS
jgi:hypothetical protein